MTEPLGRFTVADLTAQGDLQSKAAYLYADLERVPGIPELIGHLSGCLWRAPETFETRLPAGTSTLKLRWRSSAATAGIATLRTGGNDLVWLCLLVAGVDAERDDLTLDAFQTHLLAELRDTGYEPAFDLMHLRDRPLAATINFRLPPDLADQVLSGFADRSFAAAYFRYLRLA